jgi:tetratricopeptide (TPR) repeat protein
VNVRLLVGTIVAVVLAAGLGYAWYQYRLGQTAQAILARAEKLDQDGEWGQAAAYYQRYLLTDPANTNVLVQLIDVLNQGELTAGKYHQLNNLLYRTVGQLPKREDLRLMLAENLLKGGQWTEAATEAAKVSDKSPELALKARKVLAISHLQQLDTDHTIPVKDTLKELITAARELPSDYELAFFTAIAIRNRPEDVPTEYKDTVALADRLVDEAVAANPENAKARLAKYRYKILYSLPGAEDDLAAALKVDPDNPDALLAVATNKITPQSTAADLEEANTQLHQVISKTPEDLRAYLVLVEVLKLQNRPDEAIRLLQDVIGRVKDDFDLQLALATLQLGSQQVAEAQKTLEQLQRESTTYLVRLDRNKRIQNENKLRLLTAKIALAQDKLVNADTELKAIYLGEDQTTRTEPSPEWGEACLLLATIAQRQGRSDQAGPYWDALLEATPNNLGIATVAARSALESGNGNRAAEIIDRLGRTTQLTNELLVLRTQVLLLLELQRTPEDRNWHDFDEAWQSAFDLGPRPELLFARIERLRAESTDKDEILALLREGEKQFGENKEFWKGAVLQYARLESLQDQKRALANYQSLESSSLEKALVEVAVLNLNQDFQAADKVLADVAAKLPQKQQAVLQRRRVEMLAARGEVKQALKLARELLQANSIDPKLLQLGTELALLEGDQTAANAWEKKLNEISANSLEAKIIHVKRLLADFANLTADQRRELADQIQAIRQERPEWVEIVALAARATELSGDTRRAAEDYRRAFALGDRRELTLQQLVKLLYQLKLFDEAEHYFNILTKNQPDSNFAQAMGLELALRRGQPAETLEAARRDAEQFPQDPARRIYLANLLVAYGNRLEAEKVLRQAARDMPQNPQIWLGLVSYLAKDNRRSEAAEVVATIEHSANLESSDRSLMLAQGYNLVGDYAAAAQHYRVAVEASPDNISLRLQYASCLSQRSIQEARSEYENILEKDPKNQEARRGLAIALASTGNLADWSRANQLLEQLDSSSSASRDARNHLRALLLSQQGRTRAERIEKCEAARKILETQIQETADKGNPTASRLMLVQILEQEANLNGAKDLLTAARDQWQQIVAGKQATLEQQSRFIDFLLRNAEKMDDKAAFLDEATRQLEKLQEDLDSDNLGNMALYAAQSAQLKKAQGHSDEADHLVEEFVSKYSPTEATKNPVPALLTIGNLYTTVGNHAAAEKTNRQIYKLAPNAYVLVVQALLNQDKRQEAAQLCLDLGTNGLSPEVAQTLASILTTPEGTSGLEFPEAEAALNAAIEKHPTNVELLQSNAVRLASRGEYDQAIEVFRRVVELDPQNYMVLNNMATLLAEKPAQREEALKMIQQAIQLAGRQPLLLDTEGTILLKLGRADEAIVSLEEATAGGIADARYYLHLAAAYQLAHRDQDAVKMFEEALGFGLEKFLLTGDDHKFQEELNALKEKSSTPVGAPS